MKKTLITSFGIALLGLFSLASCTSTNQQEPPKISLDQTEITIAPGESAVVNISGVPANYNGTLSVNIFEMHLNVENSFAIFVANVVLNSNTKCTVTGLAPGTEKFYIYGDGLTQSQECHITVQGK